MEKGPFGNTGLFVSRLGFGAGQIGAPSLSENEAAYVLNSALDLGVTLLDTARGYGLSEERIGRHLSHRRREFVLSTKVGYGIPGQSDWTCECVRAGIDEALRVLRTDVLDVVHLHSCPVDTLARGEPLRALEDAAAAGKVRAVAYSGENEALDWAIFSGRVASVEFSVNICDQRSLAKALPAARERQIGVIAKRPLANAVFRLADCPEAPDLKEYWWRFRTMNLARQEGLDWDELALRFAAFTQGVHCSIVGTSRVENLKRNVVSLEKGPLPKELISAIEEAFVKNDPGWWSGVI